MWLRSWTWYLVLKCGKTYFMGRRKTSISQWSWHEYVTILHLVGLTCTLADNPWPNLNGKPIHGKVTLPQQVAGKGETALKCKHVWVHCFSQLLMMTIYNGGRALCCPWHFSLYGNWLFAMSVYVWISKYE